MLRSFDSPLAVHQVSEAIRKCSQNGHDLYLSGVALHSQNIQHFARALLILAIEEYGKVGWLYWALTLPTGSADGAGRWRHFWWGFYWHELKNGVGRLLVAQDSTAGLLPGIAHFFGDRFPYRGDGFQFLSVSPQQLELEKRAMLYVDFHPETEQFLGPRDLPAGNGLDNGPLIEEVETLVRYVARNVQQGVFEPQVLGAYRELHSLAVDEPDRATLLRLFFGCVLRAPAGMASELALDEVLASARKRHPDGANELVKRWTELGNVLHGAKG